MTTPLLAAEGAWTWWAWLGHQVPALKFLAETKPHYVGAWLVTITLCLMALIIGRRFRKMEDAVIPSEKLSLGGFVEVVAQFVVDLGDSVVGKDGRKFLWLTGAIFFYILVGNLFGILPGFTAPTGNMNTNLAMGLMVFVAYNAAGVSANGIGYAKHFWAPPGLGVMAIPIGLLLLVIEAISHLARPFSLSLRLFGNIDGGHQVVSVFTELVPIGVPIIFYAFETLIVAPIQAFVFTLLTMIYIAMATAHDH